MGRVLVRVAVVAAFVGSSALVAGAAGATGMSITVTPHSALQAGHTVSISGSGFAASVQVAAVECEAAPTTPAMCDLDNFVVVKTDAHGAFTTPFTVHRSLLTTTGFVNCATHACVMLAAGANFAKHATAPISFVATGGPAPTLTATPSTKLLDQQKVALAGTGFRPSKQVLVAECLSSALASACVGNVAKAAANGKVTKSFATQRILYSTSGTRVDCAKSAGTCDMLVFDPIDADYHAVAPLAFNASVPPPPAPTVSVTPSTKLPFYAKVTFSGKHWTPNDFPEIGECPPGNELVCLENPVGEAIVSAAGSFSGTGVVSRYVNNPESATPIDCAKPANHCVLLALSGENAMRASTPIAFNPAAPIPPRPSITLTPAGPYKNGQTVNFAGKNFAPNVEFSAGECIITKQLGACTGGGGSNWVTDKSGNLHGSTQLVRTVATPDGTLDCLNAKTTCTFEVDSEGNAEASVTLHFVAGSAGNAATPSVLPWFSGDGASAASMPKWAAAAEHVTPAATAWHMR